MSSSSLVLPPPTILVVHPKEKRSKCSIEPLRGRENFVFWTFPYQDVSAMQGYVRLGLEGPLLGREDSAHGLLLLDGTWRLAEKMEKDYQEIPIRSLLPWRTAYPRTSKLFEDPRSGLATIEALFAAHVQMGRSVNGLLDSYRWRDEFLSLNAGLIDSCRS